MEAGVSINGELPVLHAGGRKEKRAITRLGLPGPGLASGALA